MRGMRVIVLSVLAFLLSVSLPVAQWQSIADVDSFTMQEFGVTLKTRPSV